MARPDKIRNKKVLPLIDLIPAPAPVIPTISQENASTTTVRIAVATSESVFRIPHFARIAVIPAKKEDPTAYNIHILSIFLPVTAAFYDLFNQIGFESLHDFFHCLIL